MNIHIRNDATAELLWWLIDNGHGPKWGVEAV